MQASRGFQLLRAQPGSSLRGEPGAAVGGRPVGRAAPRSPHSSALLRTQGKEAGKEPRSPLERTEHGAGARGGERGLSGRGPRLRQKCANTASVPAAI